jgi:hypothetical protein
MIAAPDMIDAGVAGPLRRLVVREGPGLPLVAFFGG